MSDGNVVKLPSRSPTKPAPEAYPSRQVADPTSPLPAVHHQEQAVSIDVATLMEGISDGFALYDPNNKLVAWNEKFANILYYARDLMVPGVAYEDLVRKCAFEFFRSKQVTYEEKEAWVQEAFEFHRSYGTYERVTGQGTCYLVSRRRAGSGYTAVVWTDITDRKRTEEALTQSEKSHRELFEGSIQGILIESAGAILKYNRAFAGVFGLRADSNFKLQRDFDRLVAQHDRKRVRSLRQQRQTAGEGSTDYEFQGVRADGKPIWVQATSTAIMWQGCLAVQSSFQDITHRKEFEEELLSRKLESVAHMAHGVAIEFHKALTVVMGSLRLAKMEAYAAGLDLVTERLTEAEREGAGMAELVQQLLILHRGGAPVLETTTIAELLHEALAMAGRGKNIVPMWKGKPNIKIEIARHLDPISVDRSQITGVLRSLISTALESMPIGGTLEVRAQNEQLQRKTKGIPLPPGKYIKVVVADQGPGLPGEVLQRLFDPYFNSTKQAGGVGLAGAYAIAKHHGGTITVESKTGKGTRMCLYLPAAVVATARKVRRKHQ